MRSSFLSLSLLVFTLCGCSSDDDNTGGNNTAGTHKIVMQIEGSENISYIFAFAGASTSGSAARLYDKQKEYQGNTYSETGVLTGKSTEFICYTSEDGLLMTLALSLSSTQVGAKVTYSLKAYINDKLVDELQKTATFTENNVTETVSFSTTSL